MIYHNRRDDDPGEDASGDSIDLHGYEEDVTATVLALTDHLHEFDAIVVRGLSGVLLGGPVSLALGKPLAVVRKPGEDCHAYNKVGVNLQCLTRAQVLFLDDFVSMGDTRRACEHVVNEQGGKLVAQYQYSYDAFDKLV